MKKHFFYQVLFMDGTRIRREYVSKNEALSAFLTFTNEMDLLKVHTVSWGPVYS